MRYSWSYLENMLVCRIDSRKTAMVQDVSKRVNCKVESAEGSFDRVLSFARDRGYDNLVE